MYETDVTDHTRTAVLRRRKGDVRFIADVTLNAPCRKVLSVRKAFPLGRPHNFFLLFVRRMSSQTSATHPLQQFLQVVRLVRVLRGHFGSQVVFFFFVIRLFCTTHVIPIGAL